MNIIKSEKQLVDLGFKKFPRTCVQSSNILYFYQKRIRNMDGSTKYFIECNVWDWSWNKIAGEPISFEFEAQVYLKGTHNAINLTFLTPDYDEVVKTIETMFRANLIEDYDIE